MLSFSHGNLSAAQLSRQRQPWWGNRTLRWALLTRDSFSPFPHRKSTAVFKRCLVILSLCLVILSLSIEEMKGAIAGDPPTRTVTKKNIEDD